MLIQVSLNLKPRRTRKVHVNVVVDLGVKLFDVLMLCWLRNEAIPFPVVVYFHTGVKEISSGHLHFKYWAIIMIEISLKLTVANLVIVNLLVWLVLLPKSLSPQGTTSDFRLKKIYIFLFATI